MTEKDDGFDEWVQSAEMREAEAQYQRDRERFTVVTDDDEPSRLRPAFTSLTDLLAEPEEEVLYRVDELLTAGSRVVLAAQFKSGKTTMRDNLVRALADATPFLGRFRVSPLEPGRTVAVIDNEMSRGQLRRWLGDQRIRNTDNVSVLDLRGRVSTFNLMDPVTRYGWAQDLEAMGAEVVIFDCLRPVLDSLGLDESHDAGRFLVAFDALLKEAGVAEAVLVHHMGHAGERSRGDSRIRDWPDAEWRLVRLNPPGEEADPAAPRYFSAYGRDVDVPESALSYDPVTRHLTIGEGSRQDAGGIAAIDSVLAVLEDADEPMTGRAIEAALADSEHGQKDVRKAMKLAVVKGLAVADKRPNKTLYTLVRQARQSASTHTVSSASRPLGSDALKRTPEIGPSASTHCRACGDPLGTADIAAGTGMCGTCELEAS